MPAMTPLISSCVPAEAVVLPGWPQIPATGEGFEDILALCTDPVATLPPLPPETPVPVNPAIPVSPASPLSAPIEENDAVVAVVPMTSPRSWRLDSVPAEAAQTDTDTDTDRNTDIVEHDRTDERPLVAEPVVIAAVPPEIIGLAMTLPLPLPEPEPRPVPIPEYSGESENYVTKFQLHLPDENVRPENVKSAPIPAPVPAPTVAPFSPVSSAAEAGAALLHRAPSGPTPPRLDAVATPAAPVSRPEAAAPFIPAEKFAEPLGRLPAPPVQPAREPSHNKFLTIDEELNANPRKPHGIGRAKPAADMQATPEPLLAPTPFLPSRSAVPNTETVPVVVQSSASPIVTTSAIMIGTAAVSERREISLPVADAGAVVREVAELTHDFRMRERSSVEVKFNFQDETELSVRLAYRDGDVHTTFRTDSEELRVALGREWQGYAANIAQEPRGYRMADPVFTATNNFSDSAQGRDSASTSGDDARNRRPLPDPDQPAAPHSPARDHGFRPPAPALVGHRLSSDRLLHAFA